MLEMGCRTDGKVAPRMCCISPSVIPQPNDWDTSTTMTGYWRLEDPEQWAPDDALTAFLAGAGRPVVYIGFGSMAAKPAALLAMAAEICTRARCRAVIVAGWTQLDVAAVGGSDDILIVGDVPHDWLFPRVRCVVHHAGIGTMAAALLRRQDAQRGNRQSPPRRGDGREALIHYHGGPITPDTCAIKAWKARHAFISFAHYGQIGLAAEHCQSFAIDNGAFSFWKAGKQTDWKSY